MFVLKTKFFSEIGETFEKQIIVEWATNAKRNKIFSWLLFFFSSHRTHFVIG